VKPFSWGKIMHYYQHHIGDFIKDTSFLTNEEVGIYMKLIWLYYDTENPLPKNLELLTAKVNARGRQDVVQNILNIFFYESEDYYCHTRCAQVIADYHKQLETASRAGKASADKRKQNAQTASVQQETNDRSTTVQPTINHKPITINHKPSLKPIRDKSLDNGFEEFWQAYPKKVGKDAAAKSWVKVKARIDDVLPALAWQKESDQWRRNDGQFIPNPATYLNQGRWHDEQPVIDMNPF
jgi:uncharacterized protein YdaU (DUF1376 family)